MMACGSDSLKVEKLNFLKFREGALKWAHKRTANAGLATVSVCRYVRRSARNVPSLGWAVLYLSIYLVGHPLRGSVYQSTSLVGQKYSSKSTVKYLLQAPWGEQ